MAMDGRPVIFKPVPSQVAWAADTVGEPESIRTTQAPETSKISPISRNDLDTLFLTPDLYVRDMDWMAREAVCVRMSRDAYARSRFLDHRTDAEDTGEIRVPVTSLMDAYIDQRPALPPPMFIAHTALCGSTLLTQCLDIPGTCIPYREPYLFHNLSGIWRLGFQKKLHERLGRDQPPVLDLAIALAARTYEPKETSVVKLSDSCTSLLPSILDRSPGSRILLLYHGLQRFLVAMLRFPYRREYARNMRIRAEFDLRAAGRKDILPGPDLSDGRCAALVWMGLMYPYLRLLAADPGRIRSLNATAFLDDPVGVLIRLDDFFGVGIGPGRIGKHLAEGALSRHSKNADQEFDPDDYRTELQSAATRFQEEIDDAMGWVAEASAVEPIPLNLPNPI